MKHRYLYLAGITLAMASSNLSSVQADTSVTYPVANSAESSATTTVNQSETPAVQNKENDTSSADNLISQDVSDEAEVTDLVNHMTNRQKISQMLMPDFRKWQSEGSDIATDLTAVNAEIAEVIDNYDFGGVILFAENVKETEQTLQLTQAMQAAAIKNEADNGNIPLLIAIDQEGGIVYRLGSGTALPGNMALGATRDPELARQAGEIIGRELSALGINVDFAPVLDTNNNPQNPVIGLRSFSSDPNLVATLGIPLMNGIQSYNVAVAAKHFPGHGDTAVDSHTGLPLVDKSIEELNALELAPFKASMEAGVDMVMTAHIQYPQIEKDTYVSKTTGEKIHIPATLSDDILTGIVRNQYGYDGVIVTDAMNMDAISKNFGESEAAIMAINAGVDIVLMPTILRSKADLTKIDQIISDIEAAVIRGDITQSAIDASVRRILKLKAKRGILDFDLTARTSEAARAAVGSDLNRSLERKIAASAVTVVKNDDTVLPFKVSDGHHVLLLGAYNNELPGLTLGMRRLQADGVIPKEVTFESVRYDAKSSADSLKESLEKATHIVVISEIGRESHLASDHWLTRVPTEVIDYANKSGKPAVVMSISKPYDVANYPSAKAIVAVYGNKGMDPTEALRPDNAFGPNITAGVEVIFDGLEHKGTLPVAIPVVQNGLLSTDQIAYPIGFGLTYDEPAKGISLILPKAAKTNEAFPIGIHLGDLKGIEKGPYQLHIQFNQNDIEIISQDDFSVEGDTIVINRKANDLSDISLIAKSKLNGKIIPIIAINLVDKLGRVFGLGSSAFQDHSVLTTSDVTVDRPINPAHDTMSSDKNLVKNHNNFSLTPVAASAREEINRNKENAQEVLPKTGEKQTHFFTLTGFASLLSFMLLKRKRKIVN